MKEIPNEYRWGFKHKIIALKLKVRNAALTSEPHIVGSLSPESWRERYDCEAQTNRNVGELVTICEPQSLHLLSGGAGASFRELTRRLQLQCAVTGQDTWHAVDAQ